MNDIVKNNKLIAEFMDLQISKSIFGDSRVHYIIPTTLVEVIFPMNEFRFHKSYDWLMPVVEKIEDTTFKNLKGFDEEDEFEFSVFITNDVCEIESSMLDAGDGFEIEICKPNKLEAVYEAVIMFIKWYNTLKL
jgi:hypothetical protein